jgi:thioredoxin-related protein
VRIFGWLLVFAVAATAAADVEWLTDYKKAQEQAKSAKKAVLLEFTGSDWCPPCIKLKREVFDKPEFQEYAATKYVLVEIDFPRRKALSEAAQRENEELAIKYGVQVFPTTIIVDADGKPLVIMEGYPPGGVSAFIDQLEKRQKS